MHGSNWESTFTLVIVFVVICTSRLSESSESVKRRRIRSSNINLPLAFFFFYFFSHLCIILTVIINDPILIITCVVFLSFFALFYFHFFFLSLFIWLSFPRLTYHVISLFYFTAELRKNARILWRSVWKQFGRRIIWLQLPELLLCRAYYKLLPLL